MKILVTGGAGYIGSFMTRALLEKGHEVVVVDSLEKGHRVAVSGNAAFLQGNLLDKQFVEKVFQEDAFDAVIHFAAYISMKESMENPSIYFENNFLGTFNLLETMRRKHVNTFIFSSTAGVYGSPIKTPIDEDHPKSPTNPYGESKLMVEKLLSWYSKIYHVNFIALRYFNACGASLDGNFGEAHDPETHIIPNAIKAVLENRAFTLFGNDYDTQDGTCMRDYIHVIDLVDAHVLALEALQNGLKSNFYNVGTGHGFSNKEVLEMVKKVSNHDLKITIAPRRPGDANMLVANPEKIKKDLAFSPKYSDLETIVQTAWKWHEKNSK